MATLHGKGAVLYLAPGTGAAIPIAELVEYSIDVNTDFDPDPACGDTWETRLKGLMRFSGSFTANFDNAAATLWSAAISATSSAMYLYQSAAATARYYYASIWPKSLGAVSGSVTSKQKSTISFDGDGTLSTN